jgi:hypothetical protein
VVYIQALNRLTRVRWTGLTVSRGVDSSPHTGLPPSSGLGWEEKRSEVQPLGQCPLPGGYCVCGGSEGAASPGRAKTSSPGRKTVPGPLHGSAMKERVKKPAGLKTRPTWLRQDCLGASPAVGCGDARCQA